MLFHIIGWFWIITGVFFFIFPKLLRSRLQRKSKWKMRQLIFIVLFVWGAPLSVYLWKETGFFTKMILIFILLILLKMLFSATYRLAEKLIHWGAEKSPYVFRLYALFQFIMGMALLFIKKENL